MLDQIRADYERSGRNVAACMTVDKVDWLIAEIVRLREAIDAWEMDPHDYSKRPCGTCQQMTEALGKPFGCIRYALTGRSYVYRQTEQVQGTT